MLLYEVRYLKLLFTNANGKELALMYACNYKFRFQVLLLSQSIVLLKN